VLYIKLLKVINTPWCRNSLFYLRNSAFLKVYLNLIFLFTPVYEINNA
jgi:hypothetical protein